MRDVSIECRESFSLVPRLIEGLRVVQGRRVVPAFLYRYSMKLSLKKTRSPGTTEGGRSDQALGTRYRYWHILQGRAILYIFILSIYVGYLRGKLEFSQGGSGSLRALEVLCREHALGERPPHRATAANS